MKKKMEIPIMGYIGITIRIHSFIPVSGRSASMMGGRVGV